MTGDKSDSKDENDRRFKLWAKIFSGKGAGLLAVISFVAGIVVWGGFNWSLALTNSESFCISCHEMRENVYAEYRDTVHYRNRTGVRATCPDCHVPKQWHHMIKRKLMASYELVQKMRGTIDTREKFLAHRSRMAAKVWKSMRATDSRECRNCHDFQFMDIAEQTSAAAIVHAKADKQGQSCIDCHIGIAHELPEALLQQEHRRFSEEHVDCHQCHASMAGSSRANDDMSDW